MNKNIVFGVLIVLFFNVNVANATPRFQPGETLNPECPPTDSTCAVVPPATSTNGGNILYDNPIYVQDVVWQHPRDIEEITGTTSYSATYSNYGMYEIMPSAVSISGIKANVWNINANRDVTIKIFSRPNALTFNPDSVTPLYTGTISHTVMPHSSTEGGFLFNLSSTVDVLAGQYLFVIWESTAVSELYVARFSSDSSSAPYRHGFIFGTTNSTFNLSSPPAHFASTFRVYGNVDIAGELVETLDPVERITSPGFENGVFGTGIDETTIVHSGSHALKLVSSGLNWYTPQRLDTITVIPGQRYQFSFWTRGDGVNAGKYGIFDVNHLAYLNNSGNGITTGISGTTYSQFTTTFEAPAGCTSVYLYLLSSNIVGSTSYFDDISVKQFVFIRNPIPVSVQTVLNNLLSPTSLNVAFSDPNSIMTSTNTRDAIVEAYNHSETGSNYTPLSPRIVLPDNLYAVVGDKLQLFVRGMIEAQNPYNLPFVITSTVGTSYPRYFEYTPVVGEVGTKSFTIKVLDYDYSILNSKTVNLKVVNHTGQPSSPKNILTLGDSLTGGGAWPAELYRRLTQTGGSPAGLGYGNINFIGDKALPGYPTQAYTGYGGWSYSLYTGTSGTTSGHVLTGTFDKDKSDVNSTWLDSNGVTWAIEYATGGLKIHGAGSLPASGTLTHVSGATHTSNIIYTSATTEPESPFWDSANNRFSFAGWASRNGYSSIDAIYVLLGWNSTGGPNNTDYTSYINSVRTLLDRVHADFPSAIVRIVGVQIPSVNGGLGNNYGANGSLSEYYGVVRSANFMNIAYQNLANEDTYNTWVKFISIAPQFDSENNMPQALNPVNSRNNTTEYRGTNGVHPDTAGYYQIADAVYREFVNTFTSN